MTPRERLLIVELVQAAQEVALRKRLEREEQRRKMRAMEGQKAA